MTKTRRIYFPWMWNRELERANERSAQGMHLVKSRSFYKLEQCDPDARYRYALDCEEQGGFTRLLYEKQGWELVCRQGKLLWFQKKMEPGVPETAYILHGEARHALQDHLHALIRPLDLLRNLLLILSFVLILIPGEVTNHWTPRAACLPLFACIPVVKYAEAIRKSLGEDKRK